MRGTGRLVGLALVVLVASCSSPGGTRRASSPSPPAPSASPSPTGPQPAEPQSILLPGTTYTTPLFGLRMSFTLREQWWLSSEDTTSILMAPGDSLQPEQNVVFLDVQRVFEASNQRIPVKAPKDLVGWFVHHPGLKFPVKPHPVTIGGVRGTEFDAELSKAPLCPSNPNLPAGTRCWLISPFRPGDPFSPAEVANGPPFGFSTTNQGTPERSRIVILEVQGHHLLIGYGDYQNTFASTVRQFEELLQSIQFG